MTALDAERSVPVASLDDVFAPVMAGLLSGRDIDRMGLLGINQSMLAVNASRTPINDVCRGLVEKLPFVGQSVRRALRKIAKAQEQTQSLPYHNATLAAKEMLAYLLVSGLEVADAGLSEPLKDQIEAGLLATSMRYYMADKLERTWLASGGGTAELHYVDMAQADSLFSDIPERLHYLIWDAMVQGGPSARIMPRYSEELLIYRNMSDAVIIPFVGISYELNMADRMRIRVQNEHGRGERIFYNQRMIEATVPIGSARGTSYETFVRRMIDTGSAFRIRTGSVTGILR